MTNFYLGIDVSKGYADFVLFDANKKPVMDSFQLDDTFPGHCSLYAILEDFLQRHPEATVYAALESTGGYENNWFNALCSFQASLNVHCARLNPCGVKNNSKAALNRIKTDPLSARDVAEYMIAHPDKVYFDQEDQFASLRKQAKFISILTKQRTQLFNQLETIIYSAYPDILTYCRDNTPDWVLSFLQQYPTAAHAAQAQVADVAKIPYVTKQKAQQLIHEAQNSVASATDETSAQLVSTIVGQIKQLNTTIKKQTKLLYDNCSLPEVELLKSFPGIGEYAAIVLMLHIQTVHRFPSVKKLCAYFGVHPVFNESGDASGLFRMSKQGNREVRHILFMAAFSGITHNPLIKEYYHRQLQKGLSGMAALGACMHKILRIIYGMLKSGQPFDPEIDKYNRENSKAYNKEKKQEGKQRRYQNFDNNAPVSRRQRQKRKEQSEPQSTSST
jgi:transposase